MSAKSQKLARLMHKAAKPLRQAMEMPAAVEITAPLHNSMMCLLLAIAAAKESPLPVPTRRHD